jgi:hypothetical protein
VDGAEGIVVAHPEERHQLVVAAQAQQPAVCRDSTQTGRRMQC